MSAGITSSATDHAGHSSSSEREVSHSAHTIKTNDLRLVVKDRHSFPCNRNQGQGAGRLSSGEGPDHCFHGDT